MFRRPQQLIVVNECARVPSEVHHTVIEKRAPTDESVRLLKEMEEKAQEKVIESIRLGHNGFDCVVQMERDYASDQILLRAVFSLNGKQMVVNHSCSPFKKQDAIQDLVGKIAETIAIEMLKPAFSELASSLRLGAA